MDKLLSRNWINGPTGTSYEFRKALLEGKVESKIWKFAIWEPMPLIFVILMKSISQGKQEKGTRAGSMGIYCASGHDSSGIDFEALIKTEWASISESPNMGTLKQKMKFMNSTRMI